MLFTKILTTVFVIASLGGALYAQDSQVSGRITDPSSAGVGAASVALTATATGDRRESVSNTEGYYTFPALVPGVYNVTVQKEGFQSKTETGITVETGQISSVDVKLAVGEVSQSVSVDATVPLLQTDTGAVSNVVENSTIVDMPLIDRRSTQLTRQNGFIVQVGGGSSTSFAVAGGRAATPTSTLTAVRWKTSPWAPRLSIRSPGRRRGRVQRRRE